jgi:hypothetical protein
MRNTVSEATLGGRFTFPVTKLGGRRAPDKSWQPANSPQDLTDGVHENLRNLGLDALDALGNVSHVRHNDSKDLAAVCDIVALCVGTDEDVMQIVEEAHVPR